MKKYIIALLLLLTCQLSYGQSIERLFDEFSTEKNAECTNVSPFLMKLGKLFIGNDPDAQIVRCIHSMKVLDLEACSSQVKKRFNTQAARLKLNDYEELMRVNENGEKVRILIKKKKETIRKLAILCFGGDDCTLVHIRGKFHQKDIDQLIQSETKKKHGRR